MEARNSSNRGVTKKAVSRSSTKIPSTPSPASTKSSPPAFGKCSYKENEESSSMALRRQASSSSSSPALLGGGSTEQYPTDAESGIIGKKIVERLKSDVMGLRQVLRRSKKLASRRTLTSRQSTSNREGTSSIKGALRRMSRVKSDDSGGEAKGKESPRDRKGSSDDKGKEEEGGGKVEVIGEGLPLLTRLRMLREKEERERAEEEGEKKKRSEEEGGKAVEVIGEGLPLLTRLKMLREKEERERKSAGDEQPEDGKRREEGLGRPNALPEAERTTSSSQTEEGAASGCGAAAKFRRSLATAKAREDNRRSSLAKEEKPENETTRRCSNAAPESVSIASTASQISVAVVPPRTRDLDERDRGNGANPWGGARAEETGEEGAISGGRREDGCESAHCVVVQVEEEDEVVVRVSEEADNESCCAATEEKKEHRAAAKPLLSRLRGDRNYASVDDLSPEYSGLPFVKKLKILNDRQRLAELEKSASLDGGDRIPENDARGLSRSLSDGSRVSRPPRFQPSELQDAASEGEANGRSEEEEEAWRGLSPESNETPERRNLKSILKKLSGSLGVEEETKHIRRSLMRAQTVEGYAARHTKLAKSVTFNRDTLASPPRTPAPGEACALVFTPSEFSSIGSRLPIILGPEDRRFKDDEECAEEVIHGIKRVFRNQLDEIHDGFLDRFRSLELEVKKRDEIISCLQKRIEELENKPGVCSSAANGSAASPDDNSTSSDETNPFTRADSADTVVTADAADDSIAEKEDSGAKKQRANRSKEEECRFNEDDSSSVGGGDPKCLSLSTWLGEDSNTRSFSSESSIATSSSSSSQDEHQDEHHRHQITTTTNKDWEVQMLAREFERRQGARRLEEEGDEEETVAYDRLARRFLRLSRSERELLERLLGSEDETEEEGAKATARRRKNETGRKGISRRKNSPNKAGERKWRRREGGSASKAWIGQQVLNARSLEEATGSSSASFVTRSASAGEVPPFQSPLPSLATLSSTVLGMANKGICHAAPSAGQMREPDPEKAVVTISGECPSDASLSKLQ